MHITKFHQYIKPRNQNPTFNSSSVGTSLGAFYSTNLSPKVSNYDRSSYYKKDDYYNNPYGSKANPQAPMAQSLVYDKHPLSSYEYQTKMQSQQKQYQFKHNYSTSTPKMEDSRFSRFGNQSLVVPQVSSKQVYDRQAKNYNIISIKPKQVQDTIQKFPRFHLEDKDVNFYRKIQLQNEYRDRYISQIKNKQAMKWAEIRRLEDQRKQYQNPINYESQLTGMKTDFIPKDFHVKKLHQDNQNLR